MVKNWLICFKRISIQEIGNSRLSVGKSLFACVLTKISSAGSHAKSWRSALIVICFDCPQFLFFESPSIELSEGIVGLSRGL